jgi:hypothetical protein
MGNHPPKPAFDLSRGAIADASGWDNLAQLPQQDGQTSDGDARPDPVHF